MKKLVLLALAVVLVLAGFSSCVDERNLYPLTVRVYDVDESRNLVTCVDYAGNLWSFEDVEDWETGDLVSLLMNDRNTPVVFDDEIVKVRYAGGGNFDY